MVIDGYGWLYRGDNVWMVKDVRLELTDNSVSIIIHVTIYIVSRT